MESFELNIFHKILYSVLTDGSRAINLRLFPAETYGFRGWAGREAHTSAACFHPNLGIGAGVVRR